MKHWTPEEPIQTLQANPGIGTIDTISGDADRACSISERLRLKIQKGDAMTKTRRFMIPAFVLMLSASLCVGAETSDGNAAVEGNNHLRYVLTMDVDYPALGDDKIDAALRARFEDILRETLDELTGVVLFEDEPELVNEVRAGYEVVRPSARTVGVILKTYRYAAGAAHGGTRADAVNFDLRTGNALSLEDVFINPEQALSIMSEHTVEALAKSMKEEDIADAVLFEDGFGPMRENFRNFVLVPGGVRVIFQEYQILPYVFGLPEAFYSFEMLVPAGPRLEYW